MSSPANARVVSLSARWVAVALSVVLLVVASTGAAKKRADGPPHKLLDSIGKMLEASGLDYLTSWQSQEARALPPRPTLSPLVGFPSAKPNRETKPWMREFIAGTANGAALLAYSGKVPKTDSINDFTSRWFEADASKRVFISFTRSDYEAAKAVRSILKRRGYHVFTYVESESQDPPFSPYEVGGLFDSAGSHFVIDSLNARNSEGVYFEAALTSQLQRPSIDGPLKGKTFTVHGRMNCPRTAAFVKALREKGAVITYRDVESDPVAGSRVDAANKANKLVKTDDGGFLLPAIEAGGEFVDMNAEDLGAELRTCGTRKSPQHHTTSDSN